MMDNTNKHCTVCPVCRQSRGDFQPLSTSDIDFKLRGVEEICKRIVAHDPSSTKAVFFQSVNSSLGSFF